jgi:hypothetical protein
MLFQSGFQVERIVHQRNVLNLLGSLALWLRVNRPRSRVGPALVEYTNHPRMWPQIALAPLAKLLAWLRQGGRLTVIARPVPAADGFPAKAPFGDTIPGRADVD